MDSAIGGLGVAAAGDFSPLAAACRLVYAGRRTESRCSSPQRVSLIRPMRLGWVACSIGAPSPPAVGGRSSVAGGSSVVADILRCRQQTGVQRPPRDD